MLRLFRVEDNQYTQKDRYWIYEKYKWNTFFFLKKKGAFKVKLKSLKIISR